MWSTEQLLEGMVGLAALLRAAPFVIAGIFSGLEAENVAVGVVAGNLIGTLLYFVLFNLGLIALAAPVNVPARVITLDWPFLIAVTALSTVFLWLGRVTRWQGVLLLVAYVGYITVHILLR